MKVTSVKIVKILLTNKNIKLMKKVRRQDPYVPIRLPHADERIGEIYYSMVNTTHISSEEINIKLQELKGKTKLKFYKNISKYYD